MRCIALALLIKQLINHSTGNIGRTTRSGHELSPYILPTGPPICIEAKFDITQALFDQNVEGMAKEDDGGESEDECEIETPPLPSPFPNPFPSVSSSASPPASGTVPSNPRPELTRKQRYAKESRARRRAAQQELLPSEDRRLKSIARKKRTNLEAIHTPTYAEGLNATSTGWTGVRVASEKKSFTLEEVTNAPYNLRHIHWDGK
jgi:hypothetical protein